MDRGRVATGGEVFFALLLVAGCDAPTVTRAVNAPVATASSGAHAPSTAAREPAGRIRAIALTEDFVCALDREGVARCTEAGTSQSPTVVYDRLDATDIATGRGTLCASTRGGAVTCTGKALPGEAEATSARDPWTPPHAIPGLANVAGLALGRSHACAWTREGTVACWGDTPRSPGLTNVSAVVAGDEHSCALASDGTVRCWTRASPPAQVSGLTDVAQIAAGDRHTCARLRDGAVRCWGQNDAGQLGDETTTERASPVAVAGLQDAIDLVARERVTCARRRDGTVRCWGAARFTASALDGALRIDARESRACALFEGDRVVCVEGSSTPQTVAFDRAPPACLSASSRESAKVFSVALASDAGAVSYCLGDYSDDLRPEGSSCWRADFSRAALAPEAPTTTARAATDGDAEVYRTNIAGTTVRVASPGGDAREVQVASFRATPSSDRPYELEAHATDDGALVVTLNHAGEFETWEVATGRRIARFRVRGADEDDQLGRVRTLGATLFVTHCEGGQCDGRFVDPRTGRVLGRVGANVAGAVAFKVRDGVWALVDGQGAAVHWFQVTTGRRTRPPLALTPSDVEANTTALRRGADEVVIVYGGSGADSDEYRPVGGDVVRVNLHTGAVTQRLTPTPCTR